MDALRRRQEELEYVKLRQQFGDIPADIEDQGPEAERRYLRECARSLSDDQLIQAVTSYSLG